MTAEEFADAARKDPAVFDAVALGQVVFVATIASADSTFTFRVSLDYGYALAFEDRKEGGDHRVYLPMRWFV